MTNIASIAARSPIGFNVRRIREDFPILRQTAHGKPLVYLDNAATTQKPRVVLDALTAYYGEDNANVHRGVHLLSERATQAFEDARATVQRFTNAASTREIVFTRNATEGINLVAQTFGRTRLGPGDDDATDLGGLVGEAIAGAVVDQVHRVDQCEIVGLAVDLRSHDLGPVTDHL